MSRQVFKGKVLDLRVEQTVLPNGMEATLELIRHPGAAAAVPIKDGSVVVLIRQYRHAVGGFLYELPAGKLDPGEDPRDCAARELEEEVGYKAGTLAPLVSIFTTPGFTDEVIHIFKATDLAPGTQNLGHDEVLEVVEMPMAEAIAKIHDGTIRDGKTIVGLQTAWLQMSDRS